MPGVAENLLDIAGNGLNDRKWLEMDESGLNRLEIGRIARHCGEWLELARIYGNGCKWLDRWKWLFMTVTWLKMALMVENGSKLGYMV